MEKIAEGYYFMFEIGWFVDLLIPTLVRVLNGNLYLVGSKPCNCKDLKPCCIPSGGAPECKKLSLDDPSLKAFRSTDSLLPVHDTGDLAGALERSLAHKEMREKYLNSPAKKQRQAIIERVINDHEVLSTISHVQ